MFGQFVVLLDYMLSPLSVRGAALAFIPQPEYLCVTAGILGRVVF